MIRADTTRKGSFRAFGALAAVLMMATCWHVSCANPEATRSFEAGVRARDPSGNVPTTTSRFEYLGTKRCRMCHGLQYASWLASPKGRSFDSLKPGERSGAKAVAGLNVETDYRTDPRCLSCHAVGYGRPGGYVVPADGDEKQTRLSRARRGAGCESCHGPGSGFVAIMSDVYSKRRTYDVKEVRDAGRCVVTQRTCDACHNERAVCVLHLGEQPGHPSHRGRYEVQVDNRAGYHEAFPFKFRRDPGSTATESPHRPDEAGSAAQSGDVRKK